MKLFLLLMCAVLVASVSAELVENVVIERAQFYHQDVGIAAAERIRRAEEADGSGDNERLMGGSFAVLGDHPYMGGLVITLTTGEISMCGSTLLSRTRLVTAAHCWWDGRHQARQFIVVLGSTLLFSGGVRVATNQVEMQSSYNTATLANDIAMIMINQITYTNVIAPLALPNGDDRSKTFENWWAVGVGYGRTGTSESDAINQSLTELSMWVAPLASCRGWYPQMTANAMCASGNIASRGVCSGDSGGPLVYIDGIRPILIGVASFWNNICDRRAVYTRVSSQIDWIRSRI